MRNRTAAIAVMTITLVALSVPASARSFRVTSKADLPDTNVGDGICDVSGRRSKPSCTLRAAIMEANATPGADKILLATGRYELSLAGVGEDAGLTGDLDITDSVVIQGEPGGSIVDAAGLDRVFHIVDNRLSVGFRRVTIVGGQTPANTLGAGGIQVDGRSCIVDLYSAKLVGNQSANGRGEGLCMASGTLKAFGSVVDTGYNHPDCGQLTPSIASIDVVDTVAHAGL